MEKIKFGTDGWKAVIAKDFTISNVAKVALAISSWLNKKFKVPSVVVGYDCRFGGEMFLEAMAKILASKGIKVYIPDAFVTSPMISLGVAKLKAHCGIIITAGHYPAHYNGIKIKGEYGGPMLEKDLIDIENMISDEYEFDIELLNWNYLIEQGLIQYINLESIYIKHIYDHFDIERLAKSKLNVAFDAMYGSAQNILRKILPDIQLLHCEFNPGFNGVPPEPAYKNLHKLAELIEKKKDIDLSIATDGAGERIALFDKNGNYINPHLIMLVIIHYLLNYKKKTGKIVAGFSVTSKIDVFCNKFDCELERVPIGFRNVTNLMLREEILVGGQTSGGITAENTIPERDGIWIGLLIWQAIVETGKSLKELVYEVIHITGDFYYDKIDLHLNKNRRNKILEKCNDDDFHDFGNYHVQKIEKLDGSKFHFNDNEWVLIRPSRTEPVIRVYAESNTREGVKNILNSVTSVLNKI